MNTLSPSLFSFLSLFFCLFYASLLPSCPPLNASHPPLQNRCIHSRYYSMWKPVFTGCHADDFRKRKKNRTFHLSSWLESHLDKSLVIFLEALCSPWELPGIPCTGNRSRKVTSLSAGQLCLTSTAEPGPVMSLDMDFTAHGS